MSNISPQVGKGFNRSAAHCPLPRLPFMHVTEGRVVFVHAAADLPSSSRPSVFCSRHTDMYTAHSEFDLILSALCKAETIGQGLSAL